MLRSAILIAVLAQTPVPLEEEPHYAPQFENASMRVLDVFIPPGDATLLHSHAQGIVYLTLTNAEIWTESELGERRESKVKAGEVSSQDDYSRAPRAHRVGNRGRTPFRQLAVEILAPPRSKEAPAITPNAAGLKKELEDDNVIVYRIHLKPGETTGRHRHARPVILVRFPDGAAQYLEEGTEHELHQLEDASSEATAYAIAIK